MATLTDNPPRRLRRQKAGTMENIKDLAARVYSLNPYEANDNDTAPADIAEQIQQNPAEVIRYLLDIIDDLQN